MKVFSLMHHTIVDGDIVVEWFRNKSDAINRRAQLLESYNSLDEDKRQNLIWALSQPKSELIPESKNELIAWLNSHASRPW